MADNTLAIKVVADATDLLTKFAEARANVQALSSEFNKLAKASVNGGLDPASQAKFQQLAGDLIHARAEAGEFSSKLREAGVNVGGFGARAKEETAGIGGAFESLSGKVSGALQFTGIAVAIESVHKLMEVVGEAAERANEIRSMSDVLGVTTTEFQAMQIAAEEAGVGAEQLFRAEEKLATILFEARDHSGAAIEKLKELGLTNDQISNKAFGTAQMIAFLAGKLNDSATEGHEMEEMLKVLGARAGLAAAAIKELGGDTEEWAKRAQAANALSKEELDRLHEIGAWWGMLGLQIKNAGAQLIVWSSSLVPTFSAAASTMFPVLSNIAKSFGAMTDAAEKAGKAATEATKAGSAPGSVSGTINRSGTAEQGAGSAGTDDAAKAAAATKAGNAAITLDTLDSIKDQIEATKQGSAERLALIRKFYQDSLAFYNNDPSADKVKAAHRELVAETRAYGEEQKREAEKNAGDLVAAVKDGASAIMAEEGVSKASQLAQVRDLYAAELQTAVLTKEKRVEVERSLNEAITAVNREASATRQAIARSDADTDIAIAKLSIDAEKQALDQKLAAHQVNAAQKLAILRNFTAEEYSLNLESLNNELSTLNPQTAEYEKVYNQIRELKAKLVLDMAQLDRQAAADAKKEADEEAQAWKGAVGEITSAESTMIGDLLSKRKSFAASATQVAAQMVTKEIEDDARAMTTRLLLGNTEEAQKKALEQGGILYHAEIEREKAAATAAGTAQRTSTEATGQGATKAVDQSGVATHTAVEAQKTSSTATGASVRSTTETTEQARSRVLEQTAASTHTAAEAQKTSSTATATAIRSSSETTEQVRSQVLEQTVVSSHTAAEAQKSTATQTGAVIRSSTETSEQARSRVLEQTAAASHTATESEKTTATQTGAVIRSSTETTEQARSRILEQTAAASHSTTETEKTASTQTGAAIRSSTETTEQARARILEQTAASSHVAIETEKTSATQTGASVRSATESAEQVRSRILEQTAVSSHTVAEAQKTASTNTGAALRASTETSEQLRSRVLEQTAAASHTVTEAQKTATTQTGVTVRSASETTEQVRSRILDQAAASSHAIVEAQKTTATTTGTTVRSSAETIEQTRQRILEATAVATHSAAEVQKTAATHTGVAVRTATESTEDSSLISMIGRTIAKWFGFESSKTGATTAGVTARTAAQSAGDAQGLSQAILTGLGEIEVNAAVAAAGAAASVASIPIIGWAMAPEVAAETYAMTMAYAGALDVGTMKVDRDALATIHKGEMVLPAKHAEALRSIGVESFSDVVGLAQAGAQTGVAATLPGLEVGAWSIPRTMQATLHPGESVVPRDFASGLRASGALDGEGGAGGGDTNTLNQTNHFHDVHSTKEILAELAKAKRNFHPAFR